MSPAVFSAVSNRPGISLAAVVELMRPSTLIPSIVATVCAAAAVAVVLWGQRRLERLSLEKRRLEEAFERANERAAGLRGEKNQVLNIALQELPGPLADIFAHAEKIRQSPTVSTEDIVAAIDDIAAHARRMNQTLATLGEMQRLDDSRRSVQLTTVNVAAVLLEAAGNVRAAANRKNVRISLPVAKRTSLVRADVDVLRKVIESLLAGAIDVSAAGHTVSIALWQAEDRVLITVSDEGPGMAVTDPTQLLSQGGHSRSPLEGAETSARYGVALVHNLVKAMGGWLWVESDPGRGATFVIELPVVKAGP
jgi:signal transduction histidine kinase